MASKAISLRLSVRSGGPSIERVARMKIAVWHNLPSGGGKRALYDHVSGLIGRGHTVEAWCPPTADSKFLPLSGLVREHVVDLAWPVPKTSKRQMADYARDANDCWRQWTRIAVLAPGRSTPAVSISCSQIAACCCGRRQSGDSAGCPQYCICRKPYRWLYEALPRLPWLAPRIDTTPAGLKAWFLDWRSVRNKRLQAREEVDNAAAFDAVLVNSYFSRESVLRAYGMDSDVCYLGIDTGHFVPQGLQQEDYAVGFGSITPEKKPAFLHRGSR